MRMLGRLGASERFAASAAAPTASSRIVQPRSVPCSLTSTPWPSRPLEQAVDQPGAGGIHPARYPKDRAPRAYCRRCSAMLAHRRRRLARRCASSSARQAGRCSSPSCSDCSTRGSGSAIRACGLFRCWCIGQHGGQCLIRRTGAVISPAATRLAGGENLAHVSFRSKSSVFRSPAPSRSRADRRPRPRSSVARSREDGTTGRGECVPYRRYGETMEGVARRSRQRATPSRPASAATDCYAMMPAGAARNAVDCALWDLEAKQSGRAAACLHRYLGIHGRSRPPSLCRWTRRRRWQRRPAPMPRGRYSRSRSAATATLTASRRGRGGSAQPHHPRRQ